MRQPPIAFKQNRHTFRHKANIRSYVKFDSTTIFALLILSAELVIYVYAAWFDTADFQQLVLAITILSIAIYPLWHYLRSPLRHLPLVPFICLIYGVYFALPVLLPYEPYFRFKGYSVGESIYALQMTLIGLLTLLLAFYVCPTGGWAKWVPRMPRLQWSDNKARQVALLLCAVSLAARFATSIVHVPVAAQQLYLFFQELLPLGISLLFYLQLQKRLVKPYGALLWLFLIPLLLALDISTGFLYGFFRDLLLLLMIYLMVRKRIPWMAIGAFGVIGLALSLTKGNFRSEISDNSGTTSTLDRVALYANLAGSAPSDISNQDSLDKKLKVIVNRFDIHQVFAHVIAYTPQRVPFWNGESYIPILTRYIPRAFWPDKPSEEMGQLYGHRYDLLDVQDTHTSMNTPQLVEFYMNFGLLGVIFGMALIGVIYRLLQHVFESGDRGEWSLVAGAVLYSSLFNIESNFSLVFGNVVIFTIMFALLGRYLSHKKQARPVNASSQQSQSSVSRPASRGAGFR